jgi:hypothetical protein
VCAGKKIEGHGRYFFKKLILYIYIASECVLEGNKKKRINLLFQREGSIRLGEGKKSKQGKFLNLKVLKL